MYGDLSFFWEQKINLSRKAVVVFYYVPLYSIRSVLIGRLLSKTVFSYCWDTDKLRV